MDQHREFAKSPIALGADLRIAAAPITVVGAGWVGLVTAACFAELGHSVECLDIDVARVRQLQDGVAPFQEPGLRELLERHTQSGRLRFTSDADTAVAHGLIQFIAVGTPSDAEGSGELLQVQAAAQAIGDRVARDVLVVIRSAVPVGTCETVHALIAARLAQRHLASVNVTVVANPAFLREGAAIHDCMNPDRIIVGADDVETLSTMFALYAPLIRRAQQWLPMRRRSAEFTRYASNGMLAARISLMNELALLAERVDADIDEIRRGMAGDPRIGPHFLSSGCGFGGPSLPNDVRALQRSAVEHGLRLRVLAAVEDVNERQKVLLAERVIETFGSSLEGRTIAVWGLTFKPGVADLREAPSEVVITHLLRAGARVVAFDPLAMPAAQARRGACQNVAMANDPLDAVEDADALLIVTEWPQFKRINWTEVRARMRGPHVHDGRNICDPVKMAALGFRYRSVGRLSAQAHETSPHAQRPEHPPSWPTRRDAREQGVREHGTREPIAAAAPVAEHPSASDG